MAAVEWVVFCLQEQVTEVEVEKSSGPRTYAAAAAASTPLANSKSFYSKVKLHREKLHDKA